MLNPNDEFIIDDAGDVVIEAAGQGTDMVFTSFDLDLASFPFKSHAVWGLTQARRWGQIPSNKSDSWYFEVADQTFRADIYRAATGKIVDSRLKLMQRQVKIRTRFGDALVCLR